MKPTKASSSRGLGTKMQTVEAGVAQDSLWMWKQHGADMLALPDSGQTESRFVTDGKMDHSVIKSLVHMYYLIRQFLINSITKGSSHKLAAHCF